MAITRSDRFDNVLDHAEVHDVSKALNHGWVVGGAADLVHVSRIDTTS